MSTNRLDFTNNELTFEFQAAVNVSNVIPSQGSAQGGTIVTVVGSNYPSWSDISCRFDDNSVPATYISSTQIYCHTPAQPAGYARVDVSINGVDYSVSKTVFEFVDPSIVTGIGPNAGFAGVTGIVPYVELPLEDPSSAAVGLDKTSTGLFDGVNYQRARTSFSYTVLPSVTSIDPPRGSLNGGTVVTVSLSGFSHGEYLYCRLGAGTTVAATWISSSKVKCMTSAIAPGNVTIEVSSNGQDFTVNQMKFQYMNDFNVTTLTPAVVSTSGGNSLSIYGNEFPTSPSLLAFMQCRIGTSFIPASVLSSDKIKCMTPAGEIGLVGVGVTVNSVDVTFTETGVTYEERPRVFDVFPIRGSTLGGEKVWVSGLNFRKGRSLCSFDTIKVAAEFVSSSEVVCVTPAIVRGVVTLTVVNAEDGHFNPTETSLHDRFFFHFHPPPTVKTIEPTFGPQNGNIAVFVFGDEFAYSDDLSCEFGASSPTRATWLSSTRLKCVAPAHHAGNVSLAIRTSANSDAAVTNGITFTYNPQFNVTHISPNAASSAGGTIITVHGVGLSACTSGPSSCWWCRFGSTSVQANYKSSTEIQCVTPPHGSGFTTLQVFSMDGSGDRIATADLHSANFNFLPVVTAMASSYTSVLALGSVSMVMNGAGFSTSTQCLFESAAGTSISPVKYRSMVEVECDVPLLPLGITRVGTLNPGADTNLLGNSTFSTVSGADQLTRTVTKVTPSVGTVGGGTVLTIQSSASLDQSDAVMCLFGGNLVVQASWVDNMHVKCRSPASFEGNATLMLTSHKSSLLSTPLVAFEFIKPVNVTSAVSVASGNLLSINIFHTQRTASQAHLPVIARLGDFVGYGQFISSTHTSLTTTSLTLGNAGFIPLDISENAVDFINSNTAVHFHSQPPQITGVFPTSVNTRGGSEITVTGNQFQTGHKCSFGSVMSSASFVSSTEIRCTSPAITRGEMMLSLVQSASQDPNITSVSTFPISAHPAALLRMALPAVGASEGIPMRLFPCACCLCLPIAQSSLYLAHECVRWLQCYPPWCTYLK